LIINILCCYRFIILLTLIFAWLEARILLAQQAAIQGIITDQNAQVLYGANVLLQSVSNNDHVLGTTSGIDGFYRIASVEPGNYLFRISYIGYTAHEDTLEIREGENRVINITMQPDDALLDEVIIEHSTGAAWREEGIQRISPADLRRVPSPGSGDLASYLQMLPGVVAMGDRGGQVFIRGGAPSENMVMVDGVLIYQPVHIVGFFSPFPENLVSGVDFHAGGFSPRYSGRISSVMDIQMRHGDRFNTTASASVSPFVAEVAAEGPFREGESSWVMSVRHSLIEETSKWYPVQEQPLSFGSQYLKGSYIQQDSRCSGFLMHTYDSGRMDLDRDDRIQWRNLVLGGRCVALPEMTGTLLETNVGVSHFTNSISEAEPFGFSSNTLRINLDLNLRQFLGRVRFDYGIYGRLKYLNYNLGEKFVGFDSESFSLFSAGAYVETTIPVGQSMNIRPGVAFSIYPAAYNSSFEPRFRFNWRPFGRESEEVSGAVGKYLQPVVGVSDMRDLSSVFVAWMTSPIGQSQLESFHATMGWQQTPVNGLTWSAEGYYKQMKRIPVPVWSTIARFNTELALADGQVYGSDIRIEYNRGRFYGLIGYGYSWTLYESAQDHFSIWFGEPVQDYHPPHDRRHQLNTLISLEIGSFTAGIRWQFGTGLPYTRPMGFDDLLDFRDRLPMVNQDRGIRRVILDKPYQGRVPTYHRLDMSLERSFQITTTGWELNLQAGAINVYDHSNLFYYDLYTHKRIDQLPIVPYVTFKLDRKGGR
jgi:hypothetical protein